MIAIFIDAHAAMIDWDILIHAWLSELDILQHIHATHDTQAGWRSTKKNVIAINSDAYAAMIDRDMLIHAW
jgi:hypothetical protein